MTKTWSSRTNTQKALRSGDPETTREEAVRQVLAQITAAAPAIVGELIEVAKTEKGAAQARLLFDLWHSLAVEAPPEQPAAAHWSQELMDALESEASARVASRVE